MGWLRSLWDRLVNDAAEEIGGAEERVGLPLYPVRPYRAEVVPGVLERGSWPCDADLAALKGRGFRTVVNLCSEREQDVDVFRRGMVPVNLPIRDNTVPTVAQVERFLDVVRAGAPVFVHCEAGKGRTGCMVAAFRVLMQGWAATGALREAERYGLGVPAQRAWILDLGRTA